MTSRTFASASAFALAIAFAALAAPARADQPASDAPPEAPESLAEPLEGGVPAPQTEPLPTPPAPSTAPAPDTAAGKVVLRPHRSLVLLGIGLFGAAFTASAIAGGVSERPSDRWLFAPVVGPWMNLAHRDCAARPCGSNEDVAKSFLVASGLAQAAGLGVLVWGLLAPEIIETRVIVPKEPTKTSLVIVPSGAIANGAGMSVAALGTF